MINYVKNEILILAGGLGTRFSEETTLIPKPMIRINGDPIIFHLIEIFLKQGFTNFAIATGYKSDSIENYLKEKFSLQFIEDNSFGNTIEYHYSNSSQKFRIVNSGVAAFTSKRIMDSLKNSSADLVITTYGDGLANVVLSKLLSFHKSHNRIATVTAVHPPARFGYMSISDDMVTEFSEKNQAREGWINGGFFVFDNKIKSFFPDNDQPFEYSVLPRLVEHGQLMAYRHHGFWKPMDTLRDKTEFEEILKNGVNKPWLNF